MLFKTQSSSVATTNNMFAILTFCAVTVRVTGACALPNPIDASKPDVRLTGSSIPVLCQGSVKDSKTLRSLNLEGNGIGRVEPGAFANLPNLYEINLGLNRLQEVAAGVFNRLSVRSLHLNNNSISTIHPSAFDNMTHLTFVQLEFNRLARIDPGWFGNSPRVSTVLYNHNVIEEVPEGAFRNFARAFEIPVFLMDNRIRAIREDAFRDLARVGDVYLSMNRLKVVGDVFAGAEYVRNVYLDYNEIECLSEGFKMTPVVGSVNVEGNPMGCQCLLDLEYWSQLFNVTLIVNREKIDRCRWS